MAVGEGMEQQPVGEGRSGQMKEGGEKRFKVGPPMQDQHRGVKKALIKQQFKASL